MGAAQKNVSMNTKPTPPANQEKGKDTGLKKRHKEDRMRILVIAIVLGLSSSFALAECNDFMSAFNKHQLVIKGMMDLNFQGKMNAEIGDAIGKRMQEGQKEMDAGEFQKACDTYDSILDDYGFDKSFGEAPAPEKDQPAEEASGTSEAEASTAAEASSEVAPAGE